MLREFEITVPPSAERTVELRVRVHAPSWLEALAEAGRKLADELGVTISDDAADRFHEPIRVQDLGSGRQYVVSSLSGELPPRSSREGGGREEGAPPRQRSRSTSPGVQVRHPGLHRAAGVPGGGRREYDPTRLEMPAIQQRSRQGRMNTPPQWKRRRPVVRSDRLKPKPSFQPLRQGASPPSKHLDGAPFFKPVVNFDPVSDDLESILDGAVAMLVSHIPCRLAQVALWLDDREGLWVASAAGELAEDVRHGVLLLPPGLLPKGPETKDPVERSGGAVELAYEDEYGDVQRYRAETLLCIPMLARDVPLGIILLANTPDGEPFTTADMSGGVYLAKTLGSKVSEAVPRDGVVDLE